MIAIYNVTSYFIYLLRSPQNQNFISDCEVIGPIVFAAGINPVTALRAFCE